MKRPLPSAEKLQRWKVRCITLEVKRENYADALNTTAVLSPRNMSWDLSQATEIPSWPASRFAIVSDTASEPTSLKIGWASCSSILMDSGETNIGEAGGVSAGELMSTLAWPGFGDEGSGLGISCTLHRPAMPLLISFRPTSLQYCVSVFDNWTMYQALQEIYPQGRSHRAVGLL